jgi:hypothetical protein
MTTPDHPDTATVYLINGQPCSADNGPGYASLPWDEASWFVTLGYAVWGIQPPGGLAAGQPVQAV